MSHHCPMCGYLWDGIRCRTCGWYERVRKLFTAAPAEGGDVQTKAAPQEPDLRGQRVSATAIPAGAAPAQKAQGAGDETALDELLDDLMSEAAAYECSCSQAETKLIDEACREIRRKIHGLLSRTRPGWRWVPVEPTPEMLAAADEALMSTHGGMVRGSGPHKVWKIMLAAAPAERGERK